jgi:hypothetical protein
VLTRGAMISIACGYRYFGFVRNWREGAYEGLLIATKFRIGETVRIREWRRVNHAISHAEGISETFQQFALYYPCIHIEEPIWRSQRQVLALETCPLDRGLPPVLSCSLIPPTIVSRPTSTTSPPCTHCPIADAKPLWEPVTRSEVTSNQVDKRKPHKRVSICQTMERFGIPKTAPLPQHESVADGRDFGGFGWLWSSRSCGFSAGAGLDPGRVAGGAQHIPPGQQSPVPAPQCWIPQTEVHS